MSDLHQAVEDAQLQADLAKIDLIVAKMRAEVGDERLDMLDVSGIRQAARKFGVSHLNAYLRARQLCLLSWQEEPPDV